MSEGGSDGSQEGVRVLLKESCPERQVSCLHCAGVVLAKHCGFFCILYIFYIMLAHFRRSGGNFRVPGISVLLCCIMREFGQYSPTLLAMTLKDSHEGWGW